MKPLDIEGHARRTGKNALDIFAAIEAAGFKPRKGSLWSAETIDRGLALLAKKNSKQKNRGWTRATN